MKVVEPRIAFLAWLGWARDKLPEEDAAELQAIIDTYHPEVEPEATETTPVGHAPGDPRYRKRYEGEDASEIT